MALALALNFGWEMAQARFFADMAGLPIWTATWRCAYATLGDVGILLGAYLAVAAIARRVDWITAGRRAYDVAFAAAAFGASMFIERHAVTTGRWVYDSTMPVLPWIGVGFAPLVQWLLLPGLVLAFARITARGTSRSRARKRPS
jgi:hypothetical protein